MSAEAAVVALNPTETATLEIATVSVEDAADIATLEVATVSVEEAATPLELTTHAVPVSQPHYLSTRANWEAAAGAAGKAVEDDVQRILETWFEATWPGEFIVQKHPSDLRQIYYEYDYQQNPELYRKPAAPGADDVWYDEVNREFRALKGKKEVAAQCGGCIPDIKIQCKATGKSYFVECKRQNDAGNAHERCAKYATPSIVKLIQGHANGQHHPIGYLFTGALTEKRKYQVELRATFGFAADHLFFWKTQRPAAALVGWIGRVVVPLLR
jgi:hypothetical protein